MLLRAGELADAAYLLRRGQVRVYLLDHGGRETTTAVLGPGQFIGISALLGRPTHEEFAETLDDSEVWVLPVDRLLRQLVNDRPLLGLVTGALAQRLSQEVALLQNVALLSVRERARDIEATLTRQLGERPRLNQRALAELVGARPETLSRARHAQQAPGTVRYRQAHLASRCFLPERRAAEQSGTRSAGPLARAVSHVPAERFAAGEPIPSSGELADDLFVVADGLVRLFLAGPAGREVTVDIVEPGQCFGVVALTGSARARLRAHAATDARVWAVPATEVVGLLDQQPEVLRELANQIGTRVQRVERCLTRVQTPNARSRVASLLLQLATDLGEPVRGGGRRLPAGWTHDALARQIGYRRETVSRALACLQAAGYVRQVGRRLVVSDPQRLADDLG
jgi:CRP-like cAMP-binding protein